MLELAIAIPILAILLYPMFEMSAAAVSVPIEKVDTGSSSLDHKITDFYKCVSDTHKDPPSLSVIHDCYSNNVGRVSAGPFVDHFIPGFAFHHFEEQPPSIIVHSFNDHHHHFFIFHHHDRFLN